MDSVIYIILVPMVYAAVAIFVVGTVVRLVKILRAPKQPTTLQIYPQRKPAWLWALHDTFLFPTVRKHQPIFWAALMLFHAALLLLIIGHIELFADFAVFQIIPHEIFIGRGFVGLILALSLLYFLMRRLSSPFKELSVPEDFYLLILLFLAVLFGSQMDWARRWYGYGEMDVSHYRDYLVSLVTLRPELPYETTFSGHSFLLVVHIFFANLFLAFFPFSQAMHSFLSLPVNKFRRG